MPKSSGLGQAVLLIKSPYIAPHVAPVQACGPRCAANYAAFLDTVREATAGRSAEGQRHQADLASLTQLTLLAKRQLQSTGQAVVQTQVPAHLNP